MAPTPQTREACEAADAADPLAFTRARFRLPEGVIYLDGNSLGALPAATPGRLAATVEREWGAGLISSWNAAGWIDAPARVGALIAPLIGADAQGVVAADTTSINLFKLAAAALALRPDRRLILADADEFPTDLYMLQGLAAFAGREVEVRALPLAELGAALDTGEAALIVLSHVNYKRADLRDMAAWTARAHAAGALALWDLSHAAGIVEVDLAGADADFAIGCGYKYLNGGPGAPAYLYVAPRLREPARSPLSGWMGHARPFAFEGGYAPALGMARWLCGTPSILGLAALEEGLRTFEGVAVADVQAKARALGALFLARVETLMPDVFAADPPPIAERGGHVILGHPNAYEIVQALIAAGVVGDYRRPDLMRVGFAPLYLRFVDVWDAAERLAAIMADGTWREPRFARPRGGDVMDLSYGDYLQLDRILSAQEPRSGEHDELLFIVIHQASELWMRLSLHELSAAREHVRQGDLGPAFKMIARVSRIQAQLIQSWDVLATMTPSDYSAIREGLGSSSGFQSWQNRAMEFMLGQKDAAVVGHQSDPAARAALQAALAEPSLYDEALRLLARRGFELPPEVLERDWSAPYAAHPAVEAAWLAVYRAPARWWDLYELTEKLVDLEYRYQQWRFAHLKTVERIIGFKAGSGGTAGAPYLAAVLKRSFFPELLSLRTHL